MTNPTLAPTPTPETEEDTVDTKRFPRTLVEAFGPYADRTPIVTEDTPLDKALQLASAIAWTVALFALAVAFANFVFHLI